MRYDLHDHLYSPAPAVRAHISRQERNINPRPEPGAGSPPPVRDTSPWYFPPQPSPSPAPTSGGLVSGPSQPAQKVPPVKTGGGMKGPSR